MKKSLLLSAALALVAFPIPVVVHAQEANERPQDSTVQSRLERAKRKKMGGEAAKTKQPATAPLFANATREEPTRESAPKLAKALNALIALQDKAGSEDEAIAKADAILADPRATSYDKSIAAYVAGFAWLAKEPDSYKNAITYIQTAITNNGLDNNTHYQLMLQLAQMYSSEEKFAEGQATVERFLTETKSDDPRAHQIKAQILLANDKPEEAAKALELVLATKPNDKALMLNLANLYAQSGNDAKAVEMIGKLRGAGLFTESKDYDLAYRVLANIEGKEKEALALIEEGLSKDILVPTAAIYSYQGYAYYESNQVAKAIEAWSKGATLAKDGEQYLNLAKIHSQEEHWNEAKVAAKSALDKGLKKPGDAWMVIAQSETALGNKPAAKAATLQAAKYPESKKWAEAALRQTSGK